MPSRNIARTDVHFDLLVDMMSESYYTAGIIKAEKGIPDDAVFVGSTFSISRMTASLFFVHDSFTPVLEGNPVPAIGVTHSIDYTPIDLLGKVVETYEYHQYDMNEFVLAMAEVADEVKEWLDNGH